MLVEPSVSGSEIGAKESRCSSWGSLPPSVTGSLVGAKQVALLKLGQLDPIGLWYRALCPIKRVAQMVFVESTISAYKIYGYVIIKIIQHRMKSCASGSRRSSRARWRQRWKENKMGRESEGLVPCPLKITTR